MSEKLISADKLIRDLKGMLAEYDGITITGLIKSLQETPAVDAVEVVRCFGCKHSDTKQTFEVSNNRIVREYPTVRYCERFNTEVNNSFFCGYGEWRTKNANDTGKSD